MNAQEIETERLLNDAKREADRARTLFPDSDFLLTAFAEEAGEVIKAVMDCMQRKASRPEVRKEIVQAMAMLIRLEVEGDPIHSLEAGSTL